jgi:hypothetical protein
MARNVLLSVLTLSDDGRSENGVGWRDGGGGDKGGEELESGNDGVHEGGGNEPPQKHARGEDVNGVGERRVEEARTLVREALPNSSNDAGRKLYRRETQISITCQKAADKFEGRKTNLGNSTPTAKTDKAMMIRVNSRVMESV